MCALAKDVFYVYFLSFEGFFKCSSERDFCSPAIKWFYSSLFLKES